MASFYGYTILLVGISILLAIAGMNTGMGSITDLYFHNIKNADFNATNIDSSGFGITGSNSGGDSLNWLFAILGISAVFAVGVALATKDAGQGAKAGFAAMVLGFGISDFKALITYAINDPSFGGIVGIIASIIYIPLAIGYIIVAINWIGGKD